MKTAKEYRAQALELLQSNTKNFVLFTLIYLAITMVASTLCVPISLISESLGSIVQYAISLALLPVGWAYVVALLTYSRTREEIQFIELIDVYRRDDFKRIFTTMLLQFVYTILWMLLLFVPGIIKAYSYSMTQFILKDEPELENNAAIEKSMQMMQGHKMELFLLDLSYIGWIMLGILTFGIGMLWVEPYMEFAHVAFYEDLKAQQAAAPAAEVAE